MENEGLYMTMGTDFGHGADVFMPFSIVLNRMDDFGYLDYINDATYVMDDFGNAKLVPWYTYGICYGDMIYK